MSTEKPTTFEECLKALGGRPMDTMLALRVPYVSAQMMHRRKAVGAAHWPQLRDALRAKGIRVSTDDFLAMKLANRAPKAERVA